MKRCLAVLFLSFLAACGATTNTPPSSAESQLSRAQKLLAGDSNDATNLNDPNIYSSPLAGFPALRIAAVGASKGTVVLIHGAFGDHQTFRPFLRSFANAGYDGIAVARRGRDGLAPSSLQDVTFQDYLDDVKAAVAAVDHTKPVIVVGHSLGGLLAQHIAVEGGSDAVILVASAPPTQLTAQVRTVPYLAPYMTSILLGNEFKPSDSTIQTIALGGLDPTVQNYVLGTLIAESGKVYRTMIEGTGGPNLLAGHVPMFVIGGSDDWIIGPDLLLTTALAYGAPLQVFQGNSHWMLNAPNHEAITDAMIQWLATACPN